MRCPLRNIRVWKPGSPSSGSVLPQHQAVRCFVPPPLPAPASLNNARLDYAPLALWEHQEEGAGAASHGGDTTERSAFTGPWVMPADAGGWQSRDGAPESSLAERGRLYVLQGCSLLQTLTRSERDRSQPGTTGR